MQQLPYELAEKLKREGYPQHIPAIGELYYHSECDECFKNKPEITKEYTIESWNGDFEINIPTLEQLIDACGEGFLYLIKESDSWKSFSRDYTFHYGKTPSEAVAKLWLALNKK